MSSDVSKYLVPETASIRDVTGTLNKNRVGIALVLDGNGALSGTVTDGDVRRAVLANVDFDGPVTGIMCKKPVVAPSDARPEVIRGLMDEYRLHHIPVLDAQGRPVTLCHVEQFLEKPQGFSMAVIMAGGEGLRLRPMTEAIPKPMIPVGDRPLLDHMLGKLVEAGVKKIYFSVNYKADVINKYFGDGSAFGVEIEYLRENRKLGTAGSLKLLPEVSSSPFLVLNGDVFTTTDFQSLLSFHTAHRSVLTIAAVEYRIKIPYATMRLGNHYLLEMEEKPEVRFHCNAGIYAVEPEVLRFIPDGQACDMTAVIDELLQNGLPISVFPIYESWVDIGSQDDLKRAQESLPKRFVAKGKGAHG